MVTGRPILVDGCGTRSSAPADVAAAMDRGRHEPGGTTPRYGVSKLAEEHAGLFPAEPARRGFAPARTLNEIPPGLDTTGPVTRSAHPGIAARWRSPGADGRWSAAMGPSKRSRRARWRGWGRPRWRPPAALERAVGNREEPPGGGPG